VIFLTRRGSSISIRIPASVSLPAIDFARAQV